MSAPASHTPLPRRSQPPRSPDAVVECAWSAAVSLLKLHSGHAVGDVGPAATALWWRVRCSARGLPGTRHSSGYVRGFGRPADRSQHCRFDTDLTRGRFSIWTDVNSRSGCLPQAIKPAQPLRDLVPTREGLAPSPSIGLFGRCAQTTHGPGPSACRGQRG